MSNLITPHGGALHDLIVSDSLRLKIQEESIPSAINVPDAHVANPTADAEGTVEIARKLRDFR